MMKILIRNAKTGKEAFSPSDVIWDVIYDDDDDQSRDQSCWEIITFIWWTTCSRFDGHVIVVESVYVIFGAVPHLIRNKWIRRLQEGSCEYS